MHKFCLFLNVVLVVVLCVLNLSPPNVGAQLVPPNIIGEFMEPKLFGMGLRIQEIDRRVRELKGEVETEMSSNKDIVDVYHSLVARLEHLEGTGCEPNQFQCGGHDVQCIADLKVCDGHKDCNNGEDEEKHTCSSSHISAGSFFKGHSKWFACQNIKDQALYLTVSSIVSEDSFKTRPHLKGKIITKGDNDTKHVHEWSGYYNYGTKHLVFTCDDKTHGQAYETVCDFAVGGPSMENAHCVLSNVQSKEECAHVTLHKKKRFGGGKKGSLKM